MTGSGTNTVKSCLCHLPAIGPSKSHLTSLHLSFPICNMGTILLAMSNVRSLSSNVLGAQKVLKMSNMYTLTLYTVSQTLNVPVYIQIHSFYEHINTQLMCHGARTVVVKSMGSEPAASFKCQLCHILECDLGQLT